MVVQVESSRRLSGDAGTALVEAAVITPLFFYVLFGMIELGLVFRDSLALGASTQDGARTASILGNDSNSDYMVIQAVKKSTSVLPKSSIKVLVVFNATAGSTSTVPVSCATATARYQNAGAQCNAYTVADDWASGALQEPNYNCTSPGWSSGWCPTSRKTALTGANSPPDYIGIYLSVNHKYATGLFGNTKLLTSTTITRIEPQTLQ